MNKLVLLVYVISKVIKKMLFATHVKKQINFQHIEIIKIILIHINLFI